MSSPIYFFPITKREELVTCEGKLITAKLDEYGLSAVLGDVAPNSFFAVDHPTQGPGGKSGCFFATNTRGSVHVRAGYYPDFQRWTHVRRDPDLWIGIDNEFPPLPADLVRPTTIPGWKVRMADGCDYEIPVIRSPLGVTKLPRNMYRDVDGVLQVAVKPQYEQLWDRAGVLWDRHVRGDSGEDGTPLSGVFSKAGLDWSIILDECLCFLGLNYRYGTYEQSAMRLIDTSESIWLGLLFAVLDRPFLDELTQKKTPSPLPSES